MKHVCWITAAVIVCLAAPAASAEASSGSCAGRPGASACILANDLARGFVLPQVSTSLDRSPAISKPVGRPPSYLFEQDIVEGRGRRLRRGDTGVFHYRGIRWSDGGQFDSSWGRGSFDTRIGEGNLIAGWERGIPGMRAGGRRLLIVPPRFGYGRAGVPPDIPPRETIVFVVDLVAVR